MRLMVAVLLALSGFACSSASDDMGGDGTDPGNSGGSGDNGGDMGAGSGDTDSAGSDGNSGGANGSSGDGNSGDNGGSAGGGSAGAGGNSSGSDGNSDPDEPEEMLDPDVDWTALTLVYDELYTAYDGVHTFQVPVYVDGATIELSDWSAIPSSAVTIDPEPDIGGVLVTILEPVEKITIAARNGAIGGTAPIHVTIGTPEQWEAGEARYNNGVELEIPALTPEDLANLLLMPDYVVPAPPPDLACNNCHTTGAKYFEIAHSPTQAARFSDDDMRTILQMGMKPEGIGFRVLPPMFFSQTDAEAYADFHKWDATDEEITGMIIYLRSITPEGQGDIRLPDGTYVAPGGSDNPDPAMP